MARETFRETDNFYRILLHMNPVKIASVNDFRTALPSFPLVFWGPLQTVSAVASLG